MRRAQREEQQIFFTQAPVDYIARRTPAERTDTVVYTWADYPLEASWGGYPLEAQPDPRYTIGATPTNVGYVTRDQYQVWHDGRYQTTWNPDTFAGRAYEIYEWWRELNAEREARTIREMEDYIAQEREHERAIEEALEEYDTLRERARRLNPVANGVILVSEREYAQMERDWMLDPDTIYYTYPDTDDGLTVAWTERHPKRVTITYFID